MERGIGQRQIRRQNGGPSGKARDQNACPLAPLCEDRGSLPRSAPEAGAGSICASSLVAESEIWMILQALPPTIQFMHHLCAMRPDIAWQPPTITKSNCIASPRTL